MSEFQVQEVPASEAEKNGFAEFNKGTHLLVDVPSEGTISVRTPDGKKVTFAFIALNDTTQSIDILEHTGPPITEDDVSDRLGDDQKVGRPRQRVICFSGGGPDPFVSERKREREEKKPVTLTTLKLQ